MKLLYGDCLEKMDELIEEGVKVDLVLTDPPYGSTTCKWDSVIPLPEMWERLKKITNPNTAILLFSNDKFGIILKNSNMVNYRYQWVWNKEFSTNFMQAKKAPLNPLEYINVFYEKLPTYNPIFRKKTIDYERIRVSENDKKIREGKTDVTGAPYVSYYYVDDGYRYPINLLTLNSQKDECNNINRVHPTQKPISLLKYFITTYSNKGDTVLDFTMGSGSTGVACVKSMRDFIGIELDANFYTIAKNRIKKAIHEIGG